MDGRAAVELALPHTPWRPPELIAEGFERLEPVTAEVAGQRECWQERRLVIRSCQLAQAGERGLRGRLARAQTEADVAAALHASPRWRATDEMLQRPPGVGPIRSRTLVAAVPELGGLNRQEIAAWLGVAPFHRDRGPLRGKRAVGGGRAHGRAVRYMSTLAAVRHNPGLQAF